MEDDSRQETDNSPAWPSQDSAGKGPMAPLLGDFEGPCTPRLPQLLPGFCSQLPLRGGWYSGARPQAQVVCFTPQASPAGLVQATARVEQRRLAESSKRQSTSSLLHWAGRSIRSLS